MKQTLIEVRCSYAEDGKRLPQLLEESFRLYVCRSLNLAQGVCREGGRED